MWHYKCLQTIVGILRKYQDRSIVRCGLDSDQTTVNTPLNRDTRAFTMISRAITTSVTRKITMSVTRTITTSVKCAITMSVTRTITTSVTRTITMSVTRTMTMLLGDAFIKRVSTVPMLHLLSLCYVPVYYVSCTFTTLTRFHDIDTYSHYGTCTFTRTFATLLTNSLYLPRTVTLFLAHAPCHVIHYRTDWHNYCYTHTHNIHSHCWVCFWGLQAHSRCYSHIHCVECAIGGHTHTHNVIRTFTLLSVLLVFFFFSRLF